MVLNSLLIYKNSQSDINILKFCLQNIVIPVVTVDIICIYVNLFDVNLIIYLLLIYKYFYKKNT